MTRNSNMTKNLLRALRDYGYNEDAIEKIAGRNLLDYYARIK